MHLEFSPDQLPGPLARDPGALIPPIESYLSGAWKRDPDWTARMNAGQRRAFAFRDVEVVKAPSGAPSIALTGRAADLAARRGVTSWHVSLTHTGLVAEAIAAALDGAGNGRERYELAGPQTLSHREIAEIALRAAGRTRPLVNVPTPISRSAFEQWYTDTRPGQPIPDPSDPAMQQLVSEFTAQPSAEQTDSED